MSHADCQHGLCDFCVDAGRRRGEDWSESEDTALARKIWNWSVVGSVVLLILGWGFTLTTSDHVPLADILYIVAGVLFAAKFITSEEAQQMRKKSKVLIVALSVATMVGMIAANHLFNSRVKIEKPAAAISTPASAPGPITIQQGDCNAAIIGDGNSNSTTCGSNPKAKKGRSKP